MNALKLLMEDHVSVEALFERYWTTQSLWGKEELAIALVKALSAQIELEDKVVILPLLKRSPSLASQVHRYLEAQNLIKAVIKGVGIPVPPSNANEREQRLDAKVQALFDRYQPCVELEEKELFPQLQTVIGLEELERLGEELEEARRRRAAQGPSAQE